MPSEKNLQTHGTCCIKNSLSMIYNQSADQIDIWREAINNLRTLHNDVWNGVRFFLTLNAIYLAGISALAQVLPSSRMQAYIIALLGMAGFLLTLVARNIFSAQRGNYIEMLLLKTLIEKELKFYDIKLADGIDLAFPWKVDLKHLKILEENPTKWLY